MSVKGLKFLNDKGFFSKDCVSNIPFYDHYVLGKYCKLSFSSSVQKATRVLEYIHLDLWGLASSPISSGNRYFLSTTNDF